MCVAALFYTVDAEHLTQGIAVDAFAPPPGAGGRAAQAMGTRERMALAAFDKDADGRLDPAERAAALKFIAGFQGHELSPEERAGAERFLDQIGGGPAAQPTPKDGGASGDPH
jgi:hypothetical protein